MSKRKKDMTQRFAFRFLKWICPDHLCEEIEGDLIQNYERDIARVGKRKAKQRLIWSAIRFLRPGIILRNKVSLNSNQLYMVRNYFKISSRSLLKNRVFSLINISGLAVGMAAFLMIVHYVRYEYSYEDFHKNSGSIYRITLDIYKGSEYVMSDCEMYGPVGSLLKDKYPEVVDFVRLYEFSNQEVKSGDRKFYESKIYLADPSVLSVFSFAVTHGDATTALTTPFQVVLTESMAKKYFDRVDVVGEEMEISHRVFRVTGVLADPPASTHLKVDFLLSHSTLAKLWNYSENEFTGNNEYTYLLMDRNTDLNAFNKKLKVLSSGELKDQIGDDVLAADLMKDIHLYSNRSYEPEPNGSARTTNFLFIIAIFILFIAWINYINLSTARAVDRAREVGIRKVMGSLRIQLIFQFLSESTMITIFAGVVALLAIYVAIPFFISLSGQPLPLEIFMDTQFWYLFASILMTGSLLAGLYPAFVLSSFQPVAVLKGRFQSSVHGQFLRKGLVTFQFASAVILITCLCTAYLQIRHLQQQDLGINIGQTVALRAPSIQSDSLYLVQSESLKTELLKQSEIQAMTSSGALPGLNMQEVSTTGNILRPGQEKMEKGYIYYINQFDEDFIPIFKIELVAGRNFAKGQSVVNELILNEQAVHALGFKNAEEAVGSKLLAYNEEKTVVGVIKNYHHRSPKEAHIPMVFRHSDFAAYFSLRINTGDVPATLENVKSVWKKVFPDSPFDYFFLDQRYDQQYKSDQQFAKVIALFSMLAALIACLGLFGLSSFTIVQRTKEIGIRKVLGATVSQIAGLLSKDFVKLVLLAGVIAVPFAYFTMEEWLSGHATRIRLNGWMFILPSILVLAISLITVSFQTIKAALANPVKSLRSE
jgi:putative ABC transport system permease protein